ncbi:MAG: hypothetical protein UT66_C0057G0008 [candidate division CPR2 bacterium GW2011_GWC1_39_9]|nr:MAG: hypothetical protein UT66_C0057G0008 [candidate division CPR2 bacterium GW2011_GWC1_39_9]
MVIMVVAAFLTTAQSALAASQSVYGYTCIGGHGWVNNVTGKTVSAKPSPSIEPNANVVSAAALKAIQYLRSIKVSRGGKRTHPYEAQIKEAGKEYWTDPAELDALVWISAHECMEPGTIARKKYKGLFQLSDPPDWMKLGDPASETKAGCEYIKQRYRTPLKAKAFRMSNGWY